MVRKKIILISFLLFVFFSCNYTNKRPQNNNDHSIHKTSIIDTVSIISLVGNDAIDKYLNQFKKIAVDSIKILILKHLLSEIIR